MAKRGKPDEALSVEQLLGEARAALVRLSPAEALAESRERGVLVDIRSQEQRERDGALPGARVIPRNVLEWRLDPRCEHRDAEIAVPGARVILICDEGCQSSLAAATLRRFGIDATDVTGGVQAWLVDGLPIEPRGGRR